MKKATILGSAGTGKTILAVEKSKQLSDSGFKVLLLCYNELLKKQLIIETKGTNIRADSFHSFALKEIRRSTGKKRITLSNDWFKYKVLSELTQSMKNNSTSFDALIIDEAQDFRTDWIIALRETLHSDNSIMYLFADENQDLYKSGWAIPEDTFPYELTTNCRNTKKIAEKVGNIFGKNPTLCTINGPAPVFIKTERKEQLIHFTVELVEALLEEDQVSIDDLIVLTNSTQIRDEMKMLGVSEYLFTSIEKYGVPVESIYRFKGLEREIVILTMSEASDHDELLKLAYVGMSRAKVGLYVICSDSIGKLISW